MEKIATDSPAQGKVHQKAETMPAWQKIVVNLGPVRALVHSLDGLRTAWLEDRSFRRAVCQVALGWVLLCMLCLANVVSPLQALLMGALLLPVVVVELINTAIEAVTDKASPEKHPLARKAKDIGSAAVLVTRVAVTALFVVILLGSVV